MMITLKNLKKSLRLNILIGTLAWIIASVAVAGWVLSDLFNNYAKDQLASELNVHINQLLAAFNVENDKIVLDFELNDPRFNSPFSGLYWQIDKINTANQTASTPVLRSRSLWDAVLNVPYTDKNLYEIIGPENTNLFAKTKIIHPTDGTSDYRLIIAMDSAIVVPAANKFKAIMILSLGLLAVVMVIMVIVQIIISLKPLARLRNQLEQLSKGTIKHIDGDYPSEIQPLVSAFNNVIDVNLEMVDHARTQAGNLAHALKTPLSILSNSVHANNTELGVLVREQVQAAQHHVNHHLAQSRANAISHNQSVNCVVTDVLGGLLRTMQKLYADKNIVVAANDVPENWLFIGHQADLQEILGNILENAYKWAKSAIWLNTSLKLDGNRAVLIFNISDDGVGLSKAQQSKLFQRGVRLDEKTPGTGLGLSIVQDLVIAYGGSISTETSALGGLQINICLPAKQI